MKTSISSLLIIYIRPCFPCHFPLTVRHAPPHELSHALERYRQQREAPLLFNTAKNKLRFPTMHGVDEVLPPAQKSKVLFGHRRVEATFNAIMPDRLRVVCHLTRGPAVQATPLVCSLVEAQHDQSNTFHRSRSAGIRSTALNVLEDTTGHVIGDGR